MLTRVPFSANDLWVESSLRYFFASDIESAGPTISCHPHIMPVLLSTVMHESMLDEAKFRSNLSYLFHNPLIVERVLGAVDYLSFFSVARALRPLGVLGPRRGSVDITRSGLAGSNFMPPLAARVPPALRKMFNFVGSIRSERKQSSYDSLAFAKYLMTITLHPFEDGNGRLSRSIYLSDLFRYNGSVSSFVAFFCCYGLYREQLQECLMAFRTGAYGYAFSFFEKASLDASALCGSGSLAALSELISSQEIGSDFSSCQELAFQLRSELKLIF